jgi:hypothetical protein
VAKVELDIVPKGRNGPKFVSQAETVHLKRESRLAMTIQSRAQYPGPGEYIHWVFVDGTAHFEGSFRLVQYLPTVGGEPERTNV